MCRGCVFRRVVLRWSGLCDSGIRSDEALGVRVSVARIAPSLLDLGRGVLKGAHPTLKGGSVLAILDLRDSLQKLIFGVDVKKTKLVKVPAFQLHTPPPDNRSHRPLFQLVTSCAAHLLSLGTRPLIHSSTSTQLAARRPVVIFIELAVTSGGLGATRVALRERGYSQLGIVPNDATGRRVFSGISRFLPPFHSGAAPLSPSFTLIGSQDLDDNLIMPIVDDRYQALIGERRSDTLLVSDAILLARAAGVGEISGCPTSVFSSSLRQNGPPVFHEKRAAVAERLHCSPLTKANQVRYTAGATPGFSKAGIAQDDAAGRRVFSGISRFPPAFAALFSYRLISSIPRKVMANHRGVILPSVLCSDQRSGCYRLLTTLDHTVCYTSWRTLAQSSPFTVTANNQCAVDIGMFAHKTVETSLQVTELANYSGAAVAERLVRSHQGEKGVQSPAGSPDFRKWESCCAIPLVDWFSRGSPVSPAPSFRRRSILTSITLFGSQDLAFKSRLNLFTSNKLRMSDSRKLFSKVLSYNVL
ncbi:hypothetical protein PR048_024522 [Dryococelus australis]|uniref:Uncharacterized protein n=1 Tax=Dryococelus australis TaxID=614101 RepID=A0ABQ9GNS5_9NEOP|nr:hypothetical protein PR048_024522 [Dryococelus australis]